MGCASSSSNESDAVSAADTSHDDAHHAQQPQELQETHPSPHGPTPQQQRHSHSDPPSSSVACAIKASQMYTTRPSPPAPTRWCRGTAALPASPTELPGRAGINPFSAALEADVTLVPAPPGHRQQQQQQRPFSDILRQPQGSGIGTASEDISSQTDPALVLFGRQLAASSPSESCRTPGRDANSAHHPRAACRCTPSLSTRTAGVLRYSPSRRPSSSTNSGAETGTTPHDRSVLSPSPRVADAPPYGRAS